MLLLGRSIKLGDSQILFNGNLLLYGGYTHREGLLGKEHIVTCDPVEDFNDRDMVRGS